jgi:signal transduction histidine kinase
MVVDDGRGFDEQATGADRMGLRNSVRERIGRVGGDVQVWSSPGSGTSVMMSVPYSAAIESAPVLHLATDDDVERAS